MINPNNLEQLSDSLSELLDTPVSESILENCTEAQRAKLASLIYQFTTGKDVNAIILSILDYGKSKIKKHTYSDRTQNYLRDKQLIN